MTVAIAILLFIAVLIVVIIVHEMGHFFSARAVGVKVLEFAIGFPPRLFAIKRGETDYSVNLIPLGAFVKTAGENDPTVPGSLAGKSPWARMGVYFAGPLANGLLAFVLFVAFFMIPVGVIVGSGIMINQVNEDSPAEAAGIQPGDIILSLDGEDIHSWEDLHQAVNSGEEGREKELLLLRDGEEISTSLVPEFNPDEGRRLIGVLLNDWGVWVEQIYEGSPAEEAGVQPGDVIWGVDEKRIYSFDDMTEAIDSSEAGEEVTLQLQRGDKLTSVSLVPEFDPVTGQRSIGVDGRWVETYTESQRYSFWQANRFTGKIFISTPTILKDAILQDPGEAVAGPVGAGQIAVEVLKHDLSNIVFFAALISLGIGLFNLFPIPPLDGGGIVVAALEGVRRGKRLSPRALRLTYTIGAALLITLFIVITYNDIARLIRGEGFFP